MFALLFGLGVLPESATLLFVFTPLFMALMVWELKVIEEPELVKRLGREYIEYRNPPGERITPARPPSRRGVS